MIGAAISCDKTSQETEPEKGGREGKKSDEGSQQIIVVLGHGLS